MTPTKLSQSVLDHIKKNHVKQKPRWHFVAKNTLFWVVFALSIIIGGKAIGIIIESMMSVELEALGLLGFDIPLIMWVMMPTAWVLMFIAFVYLAVWGAHHTKRGYRTSLTTLVLANLLGSLMLGTISYVTEASHSVDNYLSDKVSFYKGVEERMKNFTHHNSDKGHIGGMVMEIKNGVDIIEIEDFKAQELWIIDYTDAEMKDLEGLKIGDHVLAKGEGDKDLKIFQASRIFLGDKIRKKAYKKRREFLEPEEIEHLKKRRKKLFDAREKRGLRGGENRPPRPPFGDPREFEQELEFRGE